MLKQIILETPAVAAGAEYENNTVWKDLRNESQRYGVSIVLLTSRELSEERYAESDCLPKECLLLANDGDMLSRAERLGMACVDYGEQMAAFRTRYQILSAEGVEFAYLRQIYHRLHGEPLVIAETERLVIREMTVEDAEALWEIQNHEAVRRYTEGISEDRQTELEKHRAYVEQVYPMYGYGLWGVYRKEDGKLIGRCGVQDCVYNGTGQTELGYLLHPDEWGQGYATEAVRAVTEYAFDCMSEVSIIALIEPGNDRSVRVAERAGMKFTEYGEKNGRKVACYRKVKS